jgi:hypothetical protein
MSYTSIGLTLLLAHSTDSCYSGSYRIATGRSSNWNIAQARQDTGIIYAKKKNKGAPGVGFGSSSSIAKSPRPTQWDDSNENDMDYSVFPRLEPKVLATLVPSIHTADSQLETAAAKGETIQMNNRKIPDEIYQRLEQIYGFPHFNYLKRPTMCWTDMMLTTSSSPAIGTKIGRCRSKHRLTEPPPAVLECARSTH